MGNFAGDQFARFPAKRCTRLDLSFRSIDRAAHPDRIALSNDG